MENFIGQTVDIDKVKKSGARLAWVKSWNKEKDPPSFIFENKKNWMYWSTNPKGDWEYVMVSDKLVSKDLIH